MNHLGGRERMVCVEWLHKAHLYGLPCVSHLWKATQEQRDLRCHMLRSCAATWQYGLCLDHIGCNNLAIWTVGGSGMIGWSASIWSKGRLLKGPVLVKIKSCGESAQPLQMKESKYLAMSLVKDNLSIKT